MEVLDTAYGKVGCAICYDIRFPELFRHSMLNGAVMHLLPAAFPHPRLEHWQTLIRARAIENQFFMIACNQCGVELHSDGVGQTKYFGHSMIVSPFGEVVLEADESESLFVAEIDLDEIAKARKAMTALDDRRPDLY
jgi:Predicted amidohydrolase